MGTISETISLPLLIISLLLGFYIGLKLYQTGAAGAGVSTGGGLFTPGGPGGVYSKAAFYTIANPLPGGGNVLGIVYTGHLLVTDLKPQPLNAWNVKLVLTLDDGTFQDLWLAGTLQPYQGITLPLPTQVTGYLIYYREQDGELHELVGMHVLPG